jgi:acid phosphatase family membrane protein YuiD
MPSSHSALCTALTASVALCHGVRDALFPVCLGFSLIVMYDATGVRRHAGMQAEVSA